jgi:hypothetical protein
MQKHVPGRDAILARVCIRDADETGPARAGVGWKLCSLDVEVDGVAWALAIVGRHTSACSSCAVILVIQRQGCDSLEAYGSRIERR